MLSKKNRKWKNKKNCNRFLHHFILNWTKEPEKSQMYERQRKFSAENEKFVTQSMTFGKLSSVCFLCFLSKIFWGIWWTKPWLTFGLSIFIDLANRFCQNQILFCLLGSFSYFEMKWRKSFRKWSFFHHTQRRNFANQCTEK